MRYLYTLLFGFVLMISGTTSAVAQSRIAVLPFDDTEGSQTVATRMTELLTAGGRDVVFGVPVFQRVNTHRVDADIDLAAEFAGISEQIATGINQFFFAGHNEALKLLSPVLQKGIQHFDYVSTRPDLIAQLYEAALIMVRAYGGAQRNEDMATAADLLARYFPVMSPSLKNSPPDVVSLIRETKASVLDLPGARLGIEPKHAGNCRRYLNGAPIKEGAYPVAPDTDLYVYIECDGQRSPVWRIRVAAGKTVVVPISMDTFDSLTMTDDSFESRRTAEEVMAGIAFWGGFDEVVGMRQPATINTAPMLFGHLKDGRITWTETRDVPAFVGYIEQTFDVSAKGVQAETHAQKPAAPTDWVSIGIISGGLVSAGLGTMFLFFGANEATTLKCSGSTLQTPSADECEGVENVGPLSEDDFNARKSKADTFRVGGFSLIGIGIGLAGWGIYRLVSTSDQHTAARFVPTHDGFVWRFQ